MQYARRDDIITCQGGSLSQLLVAAHRTAYELHATNSIYFTIGSRGSVRAMSEASLGQVFRSFGLEVASPAYELLGSSPYVVMVFSGTLYLSSPKGTVEMVPRATGFYPAGTINFDRQMSASRSASRIKPGSSGYRFDGTGTFW